jgi:transcriptional regulator with XRE-family HTH domain
MASVHGSASAGSVPEMTIIEIDGAPYIAAAWLEKRIYRDEARAKRWRQDARRMAHRTDPDGIALYSAYLWHSLAMSYRVDKWRQSLARTQAAIVCMQQHTRVDFGLLIQERRLAAGMKRLELAKRTGLDRKTIFNIEKASFAPSVRALQAIVAVRELYLTWADVSPILLEENPADGRKHRKAPKRKARRRRKAKHRASQASVAAQPCP